ncbi:MAG: hypothetical protein AB1425_09180, partial [Actinomycetota bacterium]
MSPERRRHPVLGVLAYLLVPGERRARAAGHFRRAGMEVVRGVAAFVRPEPERSGEMRRQKI